MRPLKFRQTELLYELMPQRITHILLVSTLYDAFIIEKDGQILEQIYSEFIELQLSHMPKITKVSSCQQALQILAQKKFDLVITMRNLPDTDAFQLAAAIKQAHEHLPVVLLLSDPSYLSAPPLHRHGLDAVFFWSGDPALFFAIIKAIEDRLNLEHDVASGLVKIILVVDDSVKYYSAFLPIIYGEVLKQTQRLIKEGLNDVQKILRKRTRPKILLTTSYEQAMQVFNDHRENILGVITDIAFPKNGEVTDAAGFAFAKHLRNFSRDLPVILMSANESNRQRAAREGLSYVNKNSRLFHSELRDFIIENMGFGDFIFRLPNGAEIDRAVTIKELQEKLLTIPDESFLYHSARNHISLWLMARGEYEIAFQIRPKHAADFGGDVGKTRRYLVDTLANYRDEEQTGIVVYYKPGDWDSTFIQIGNGSLGGKARGIAFINYLLATTSIRKRFCDVKICIPKTVAITVEAFDQFIADNHLNKAFNESDDRNIAQKFLAATLSPMFVDILYDFLQHSHDPLAVRSSSLLEDSQYLPFAGIYSTYMLPNNHPDIEVRVQHLTRAIKLVYASVFARRSRFYIESSPYKIDEEKMGVVIQQIVGHRYRHHLYPDLSGVAQSYNYYPLSHMKQEEGVAQIALGLGKLVIEGEKSVRFSPKYPEIIPQFSSLAYAVKSAQKHFYAVDLERDAATIFLDDAATLASLKIKDAAPEILNYVSSVVAIDDNCLKEDSTARGPRIVTFANILKHKGFPLAEIIAELLSILKASIAKDIEIEFAVTLPQKSGMRPTFYLLQVRPLVVHKEEIEINDEERGYTNAICRCKKSLGNGISGVNDIVYVIPDRFDSAKTREIAEEIGEINARLRQQDRRYLLIGIGRWGTADPWLGIPVNWEQICNVQAMVETTIADFFIEPSQGSHFFQNITARSVGYFSISGKDPEEFVNWEYLQQLPAMETQYLRHIKMPTPIGIKINGKTGEGVICKPVFQVCRNCDQYGMCKFRRARCRIWDEENSCANRVQPS